MIRGLTKHHIANLDIFIQITIERMNFNEFLVCFSQPRINRYYIATGSSEDKTIRLYKANLNVSKSFHPLIGVLEVALRNKLNNIISNHFTDSEWIINQKTGFMIHSSLTYVHKKTGRPKTNHFLLNEVNRAERRLIKAGAIVTSGKIISEQTLGFWTDFFEVHNYKLLRGAPIKVFSSLPSGYGRKQVNDELNKVRLFRNRINHNEPICFSGNNIDFSETLEVYESIIKLLKWLDPQLLIFISEFDDIKRNINRASSFDSIIAQFFKKFIK
jgi:hypothetical protein